MRIQQTYICICCIYRLELGRCAFYTNPALKCHINYVTPVEVGVLGKFNTLARVQHEWNEQPHSKGFPEFYSFWQRNLRKPQAATPKNWGGREGNKIKFFRITQRGWRLMMMFVAMEGEGVGDCVAHTISQWPRQLAGWGWLKPIHRRTTGEATNRLSIYECYMVITCADWDWLSIESSSSSAAAEAACLELLTPPLRTGLGSPKSSRKK